MTIVFRVDASPTIGLGHLTRCRALAQALCEKNHHCIMVGPDLTYSNPTDFKIFADWIPIANWSTATEDANKLIAIAQYHRAEWLVIDDYRVDNVYQLGIRSAGLRWLQFDSTALKPLWADIIVNANPLAQANDYRAVVQHRSAHLLLGPRYAILRPEFKSVLRRAANRPVKQILVTFGGGDDRGANEFVLSNLLPILPNDVHFSVVSGSSNPNNEKLKYWINSFGSGRAVLHINPESVSSLFASCDLAVIAGGTTTYEAAFCALPMIVIPIADNQIKQSDGWAALGAAVNLGEFRDVKSTNLISNVIDILDDETKRKNMAIKGACLVNGSGASVTAEFAVNLFNQI